MIIFGYLIKADGRDWEIATDPVNRPLRVEHIPGTLDTAEFWIQVDDVKDQDRRVFRLVATGEDIPPGYVVAGSAGRSQSGLTWHLLERWPLAGENEDTDAAAATGAPATRASSAASA